MQRELSKKNRELDELNKLKNQFLGIAAHDLRNPLGIIMSYSDFLLDDLSPELSDDHKKMLHTIQNSSEFMHQLLEELLDISAIESGKLTLGFQKADLLALVTKNVSLNAIIAVKKDIQIQVVANDNIPNVLIDTYKIEQVLNNLISNAMKFSQPGTLIKVSLCASAEEVTVSVADQGQGIPTDEIEKLFKPFQKTSVKSTNGEKSTGLGLSIVRNIILGHGGRIWVESKVGEGSNFVFTIPLNN